MCMACLLMLQSGVYYLPSDLQSCFTGEPSLRQRDTWGVKEWTEYNERQAVKQTAKQFGDDVKAYKKSLSNSEVGTSRLPPAFSTKASRATRAALTPDDTQASQVSEVPTAGISVNATSVKEDSTTVCGHIRIVPGSVPVTATNTSLGSTGPGLKPL
jgi:hypothetical protein